MKNFFKTIVFFLFFFGLVFYATAQYTIQLNKENLIAQAGEKMGWGFFQFPTLAVYDGNMYVSWSMNSDDVSTLGKGRIVRMSSSDLGNSWQNSQPAQSEEGTLLPNGCRLKVYSRPSVKIPAAIHSKSLGELTNSYSKKKVRFYFDKDLPAEYQGAYLAKKCGDNFEPFKVKMNDPDFIRYEEGGILPFVWWGQIVVDPDNQKLYAAMAPGYYLENGEIQPSGVIMYESSDNGLSWDKRGMIKYQVDSQLDKLGRKANTSDGFSEPAFLILEDGTFICVARSTNGFGNRPLYVSKSVDKGKTWSTPRVIAESGVLPRLIQLENGVIVLAAGRPGVQLYYSADGGDSWSEEYSVLDRSIGTCGYTGLQELEGNQFALVYSDFERKNAEGQNRKAIISKIFTVKKKFGLFSRWF